MGSFDASLSKNEVWEKARAEFERDKKFLADFRRERDERRMQVDALVPAADSGSKDELVANGPQEKHRVNAQHNRVFLWRNAVAGADLALRFAKLESKKSSKQCSK